MARIRESRSRFRMLEDGLQGASIILRCWRFRLYSGRLGPEITVKQARRWAKWINARCDERERQGDE